MVIYRYWRWCNVDVYDVVELNDDDDYDDKHGYDNEEISRISDVCV